MSLDLWCAGVKLGGGGRWWDEGQVGTCHANRPGVMKDGREAWIDGLVGLVTSHGGWHLYRGVTVLTELRRWTCTSSGSSRRLGGQAIEDGGDTHRVAGDAYGICYSRAVWWVEPQNDLDLKTRAKVPRRNRRHVAASRSSRRGEAISWKTWWPSDEDYLRLDHNALGSSGSTQNM
jgi:hypothetical protein